MLYHVKAVKDSHCQKTEMKLDEIDICKSRFLLLATYLPGIDLNFFSHWSIGLEGGNLH